MNVGKIKRSGTGKTLAAGGLALMAALAFGCLNAGQAQAQTTFTVNAGTGGTGGSTDGTTGSNGSVGSPAPSPTNITNPVITTPPALGAANGPTAASGANGGNGGKGGSVEARASETDFTQADPFNLSLGSQGGTGGDNTGAAGKGGNGGLGGDTTYILDIATKFKDITLTSTGGNGGAAGGDSGDGGQGGLVTLKDAGSNTVTSLSGTLGLVSNKGTTPGGGIVGKGGNVVVDIKGTLKVDAGDKAKINISSNDDGNRGTINANINTLLVEGGAGGSEFAITKPATLTASDRVIFNTIKLDATNGSATFDSDTGGVNHNVDDGFKFTNVHVVGGAALPTNASALTLEGSFTTTADTHLIFDAIGVAANNTMLTVTNNIDLVGLKSTDQVVMVADSKSDYRSLTNQVTLINAASVSAITGSMYGTATDSTVTHMSQIGTSRFYYTTTGTTANGLVYNGDITEYSVGHAYAQMAVTGLQTATDSFVINTLETVDDVVEIADPNTFALTGRASYFTIESETGSHADIDTVAAAIAAGYKIESGAGLTTLGAFFEYGRGDYDTSATIAGWGKVRGDGEATNVGGGLFAHHDFNQGTYLEGSVRFGNVDQDYKIKNIAGSKFDTDANYWGFHLGAGHKFDITNCAVLDLYGKLFYTSIDSMSGRNSRGERLHIDSADSIRTRLGGRVTQSFTDSPVQVYYGAAWEHEFDGESRAKVDGVKTKKGDISGSSAFGEAGLIFKPENANFAVEAGVFGLVGTQEGGGGTISLKYEF